MINWLKKHHIIHTWSKWTTVEEQYWRNDPGVTYTAPFQIYYWQKRHCEICNKEQRVRIT